MKTYLTSGFAAALIASATFAGSAFAQTQYEPYAESPPNLDDSQVDTMSTGSIETNRVWMNNGTMSDTDVDNSQDPGDFYEGALRPTN